MTRAMDFDHSAAMPALLVAVAHAEARATWAAELEKLKGQELTALAALQSSLLAASRLLPPVAASSLKSAIREALVRADVVANSTRQAFAMTEAASALDPDSVTRALRNEVRLKAARVVLLGTLAAKLDARVAAAVAAGTASGVGDADDTANMSVPGASAVPMPASQPSATSAAPSRSASARPSGGSGDVPQRLPFRVCGALSSILFSAGAGPAGFAAAGGGSADLTTRRLAAAVAPAPASATVAASVAVAYSAAAAERSVSDSAPAAHTDSAAPRSRAGSHGSARGAATATAALSAGSSGSARAAPAAGSGSDIFGPPAAVAAASSTSSSAASSSSLQPGRAEHLTVVQRGILSRWLETNLHHPYPTAADKAALAEVAGTTVERVSNW